MRSIRLYWCRAHNFGDELGPYIVSHLSGRNIVYREVRNRSIKDYINTLIGVLKRLLKLKPLLFYRLFIPIGSKVILSIGSILGDSNDNCIVWGAGIMVRNQRVDGGDFRAVRGKISQNRLKSLGYEPPDIIGDPALLLPIVYKTKAKKKYFIGIVPHLHDYKAFLSHFKEREDILLINLSMNVEQVIDDINCCDNIISTSLHGLIVSHAYRIPALWFSNGNIGGDNVKFEDYFSSVGISAYSPFLNYDKMSFSREEIYKLFDENKEISICGIDNVTSICSGLLKSAPFDINQKFRTHIDF
jgi:pyruvyltransferase